MRRARTSDVPRIQALVAPLVQERILLGKESVVFYEAVQEFRVVEGDDGNLIGCGALHVMWGTSARCAPWRSPPTGSAAASGTR